MPLGVLASWRPTILMRNSCHCASSRCVRKPTRRPCSRWETCESKTRTFAVMKRQSKVQEAGKDSCLDGGACEGNPILFNDDGNCITCPSHKGGKAANKGRGHVWSLAKACNGHKCTARGSQGSLSKANLAMRSANSFHGWCWCPRTSRR